MRAGTLRQFFTLEDPGQTVTDGDASIPWPVQDTVAGDLRGVAGSALGLLPELDYRLTIRFHAALATAGMRWRIGLVGTTRKFDILSCVDPTGRRQELLLNLKERQ